MNTVGTVDRPLTRDPMMQILSATPPASDLPARDTSGARAPRQNRNRQMQLIPEALARAHVHERLREAEAHRPAVRLAAARRLQRRAERATLRARRALAVAVIH
ncbi:hypothetical protein RKE29_10020 [Streptomyces sp. B1866]|uniref:hypothetical protein n=1 Tax=Streptomyces sp. B1866 TaxID=3075431 RepID=UPI00288FEEE1|nr:hypothetical protein [Streptomyces sp. B1866]MDT3396979.1 hypothetical protein [Streptomyces sp. B1866]